MSMMPGDAADVHDSWSKHRRAARARNKQGPLPPTLPRLQPAAARRDWTVDGEGECVWAHAHTHCAQERDAVDSWSHWTALDRLPGVPGTRGRSTYAKVPSKSLRLPYYYNYYSVVILKSARCCAGHDARARCSPSAPARAVEFVAAPPALRFVSSR